LHPNRNSDAIAADVSVKVGLASTVQIGKLFALASKQNGNQDDAEEVNKKGRNQMSSQKVQVTGPLIPLLSLTLPPLLPGFRWFEYFEDE
jgi:hypothetical protein